MSGRRLLDAFSLLNASRNVAQKHLQLQNRALDIRTQTSSLTKGVKNQVDRVNLAIQAASDLARKLDEDPSPTFVPNENRQTYPIPETINQAGLNGQDRVSYNEISNPKTIHRNSSGPVVTSAGSKGIAHPPITATSAGPAASNVSEPSTGTIQNEKHGDVQEESLSEDMMRQLFRSPNVTKSLFRESTYKPEPKSSAASPFEPSNSSIENGQNSTMDAQSVDNSTMKPTAESRVFIQPTMAGVLATTKTENLLDGTLPSTEVPNITTEDVSQIIDESSKGAYKMVQSRVPVSRIGRLWEYGGLATSLAFGVVGESFRRARGSDDAVAGSLLLSPANIERLVAKLSKMRGAALKMGQMMSFQDSKMLPPSIQEVLQRVQDKANYMPVFQRDQVLSSNLGSDWRDLFTSFDEIPMAAASIGQVHGAILKETGQRVAVKVQYPGVADSIDSDLNNLSILLTASRLLPKGLYLDKTIANARTELAWECDYIREAECGHKFRELLKDETDTFVVPEIISSASGKQVLTMERLDGIAVTRINSFTQAQRDWIGTQILRLCLREITEFRYMQTDPNWTNFLYNSKTQRLELLDFGASREYPSDFISSYLRLLLAASRNDRETCRKVSIDLGYLTGFESEAMVDAHVSSITTIAEPFMASSPEVYDFSNQTITDRVRDLIPLMLRERLSPPPEETYSLHRKLSGAFLLCSRLGSRVRCRELFDNAIEKVEWVDQTDRKAV
ncbi:hypothetical protein FQN57_006383 [Myotisia sp. PD_48]|nr:hypothetical protein FQN57_006383 [Myotisia sp. PD_48]